MARRANGEGTFWHDKKRRRWEGRITVWEDGRPRRRKVTAPTKREAIQRLEQLRASLDAGHDLARRDLTVSRFLATWLDDVIPGSVSASTEQQYRDVTRLYIVPHIGHRRLRELTARDVTRMIRKLDQAGKSPNTQRLARSVLRRALRWAEAEGMVARNVAALAEGVKIGDTSGRALTPDEARALLVAAEGHRLEVAVTVALSLGLRLGELLGLAWPDITLDGTPARLVVTRSLKRLPGKGLVLDETKTSGSRRTLHLPAPLVRALKAHRRRQAAERLEAGDLWDPLPLGADLVFRTPAGTALDPANVRHAVYNLTEAAGIGRRTPHELRHSAASLLIAQGVPLKLVSETLGHSSVRITADVYGHLFDEARSEAADAMTAALWGAG